MRGCDGEKEILRLNQILIVMVGILLTNMRTLFEDLHGIQQNPNILLVEGGIKLSFSMPFRNKICILYYLMSDLPTSSRGDRVREPRETREARESKGYKGYKGNRETGETRETRETRE